MIKICSLSSGSKGNSIYIETGDTRILIDAGLSGLQIQKRLISIGVDPHSIDAIVLTHAHLDHVRGVGVFSRKFGTAIHGHPETLDSITRHLRGSEPLIPWRAGFRIGHFQFFPFPVSHDAYPTVGYRISAGSKTLAVCTDLGVVTGEVIDNLQRCQFLILESNHDPDMLMNGPYPWELKERIASRVGHLSNHDTGLLLKNILNGRIRQILLAHLSDENNTPELARGTVLEYLGNGHSDIIRVLEQRTVSSVFEF